MSQIRVDPEIVILEVNHSDSETEYSNSLPPTPTFTPPLSPTFTLPLSPTPTLPLSPTPTLFLEYEINRPEDPKGTYFMSDESDIEDVVKLDSVLAPVPCETLDIGLLGDTSEENSTSPTSNSDVDPELPRNDYLNFEKCLLCKTERKNSSYPYCWRCFSKKKNFFPNRPNRPKKRRKILEKHNEIESNNSRFQNLNVQNRPQLIEINEKNSTQGNDSKKADGLFQDSGKDNHGPQILEDVVDASQKPSTSNSTQSGSTLGNSSLEMCRVCFLKPENGLFVHSSTAHIYGCYACAKKIWCNTSGCPVCRTKILKVVKLYA